MFVQVPYLRVRGAKSLTLPPGELVIETPRELVLVSAVVVCVA